MRRAARTDANQAEIVEALRQAGASVQLLHAVGEGCPDLAVGYRGQTYFIEVKTPGGSLNEREQKWHQQWRGHVAVVRSAEEALRVIGAL
jgi:hypothetical protein